MHMHTNRNKCGCLEGCDIFGLAEICKRFTETLCLLCRIEEDLASL